MVLIRTFSYYHLIPTSHSFNKTLNVKGKTTFSKRIPHILLTSIKNIKFITKWSIKYTTLYHQLSRKLLTIHSLHFQFQLLQLVAKLMARREQVIFTSICAVIKYKLLTSNLCSTLSVFIRQIPSGDLL